MTCPGDLRYCGSHRHHGDPIRSEHLGYRAWPQINLTFHSAWKVTGSPLEISQDGPMYWLVLLGDLRPTGQTLISLEAAGRPSLQFYILGIQLRFQRSKVPLESLQTLRNSRRKWTPWAGFYRSQSRLSG